MHGPRDVALQLELCVMSSELFAGYLRCHCASCSLCICVLTISMLLISSSRTLLLKSSCHIPASSCILAQYRALPSLLFGRHATTATMTDTSTYKFNHSMIRIKDPKASLAFYKHLGMSEVNKFEVRPHLYAVPFDGHVRDMSQSPPCESPYGQAHD